MRILQWTWLMVLATMITTAQVVERRGTSVVTEGQSYVVAFPEVHAAPTEKPLPIPMVIHLYSRFPCTVRITSAATDPAVSLINRTIQLKADTAYPFSVSTAYMNGVGRNGERESEVVRGLGIRIEASMPISVFTEQRWHGNGEMTRHLPVQAWGTEYYSMNMYQDRYGTANAGFKYRSSQIVVTAAYDSTDVTYIPSVATQGSQSYPSLAARTERTVRLNAGQTFTIKDLIDTTKLRNLNHDLSGTHIRANKPISVISGHTKAAIMRMPDVLPPTGMFSADAHLVRNNVHDVMMPTALTGTQFITVPTMYTSIRRFQGAMPDYGMDDDAGDVIRFTAINGNTTISVQRADGQGMRVVKTLQRGESHVELACTEASYWESSQPVLVAQYGKSWARVLPPSITTSKGSDGHAQAHPTVEAGMPMMQIVPPLDRAITQGSFYAPPGHDNFLSVVFKTGHEGSITLDDHVPLSTLNPTPIPGTAYSYVHTPVFPGTHTVKSAHDSIRFHGWTYGSLDGLQQGRAYGTTLGYDIGVSCGDSIAITDSQGCDVTATVTLVPRGAACTAISVVAADTLVNAALQVDTTFQSGVSTSAAYIVTFPDNLAAGRAVVRMETASGSWVTRTYTYDPAVRSPRVILSGLPATAGPIHVDSLSCVQARLVNPTTDTVDVLNIRFRRDLTGGSVAPRNVRIAPGDGADIEICHPSYAKAGVAADTILANVGCGTQQMGIVQSRFADPVIQCFDQTWFDTPSTSPGIEKPVVIRNAGDVPLTIRAIAGDPLDLATSSFGNVRGLDALPIVIPAKSNYTWYVTYAPKGEANVQHRATVIISSDADGTDSLTTLTGRAVTTSVESDTPEAFSIAPNPTTGLLHLGSVDGVTSMQLVSQHGSVSELPVHTTIDLGHMPTGVYTLRMVGNQSVHVTRVVLTR